MRVCDSASDGGDGVGPKLPGKTTELGSGSAGAGGREPPSGVACAGTFATGVSEDSIASRCANCFAVAGNLAGLGCGTGDGDTRFLLPMGVPLMIERVNAICLVGASARTQSL